MMPPVRITISGEHWAVGAAARQTCGASDTGGTNAACWSGALSRGAYPHGGGGALGDALRLPEETFPAVPLAPNCFFVSAPLRHYALDVGDTVGAGWDAQDHDRLRVTDVYCLQPGWYVRGYIRGFEREQECGEGAAGQESACRRAMRQTVGSATTELCLVPEIQSAPVDRYVRCAATPGNHCRDVMPRRAASLVTRLGCRKAARGESLGERKGAGRRRSRTLSGGTGPGMVCPGSCYSRIPAAYSNPGSRQRGLAIAYRGGRIR